MFVCDLISSRVGIQPPFKPSEYSFQLGRIYSGTSPHEDWFPICDFLQCISVNLLHNLFEFPVIVPLLAR